MSSGELKSKGSKLLKKEKAKQRLPYRSRGSKNSKSIPTSLVNLYSLIFIEKPGTAVFLLKESAKLQR
jgi:hypothetical protein